ncbi:MAG: hypothetical protein LBR69_08150 [Endomicrobium sp.]|nr:hypothetical protein [Endomicrobium sp.]
MKNVNGCIADSFKSRNGGVFEFFIDKDFTAFQGHFPDNPVLPGIVQIEIALFCVKNFLNKNDAVLKEVKKVKFVKPVLPDAAIAAVLTESGGFYNITIKNDKEIYSQISIAIS